MNSVQRVSFLKLKVWVDEDITIVHLDGISTWFGFTTRGHTVLGTDHILKLCSCLQRLNGLHLSDLFFWSIRCRIPSCCSLPLYVSLTIRLLYGNGVIQKNKSAVPVRSDIRNTQVIKIWTATCLPHKRKRKFVLSSPCHLCSGYSDYTSKCRAVEMEYCPGCKIPRDWEYPPLCQV